MLEVAGHVGQGDVHGRDVEDDHELGQTEQSEQRHAGGKAIGSETVAVGLGGRLRLWAMGKEARVA